MDFSVSVIIPAYNCERFIEKAIRSALSQPEVYEVLVINDGSTDQTLSISKKIEKSNQKVKILYHKNGVNRGRSASRNLGVKRATGNFIAFLDADDYYLEDRFLSDQKLFHLNPDADGAYNAVGFYFYRDATEEERRTLTLNTVTQKIPPDVLFEALISGKYSHFHINGLTVKRSVFDRTGLFNEALVVAEDTDIFWKMAMTSRLETGVIDKALAIRGVHEENVFDRKDIYKGYTIKMYESLIYWSVTNGISRKRIDTLLKWVWLLKYKEHSKLLVHIKYWGFLFFKDLRLLFSTLSIKYFPVVRLRQKLFPFLFKP
ncbi:glycosyltransferase family 2 protein [Hyunsoonleella sp. SJ7]|uniref:Glycosyltransferase family 2 protein n=1 Tax=Hyunsoonleella aquatilis TaxID=2762758 RepID=A0A923H766_9FLAO|nr:glycosyltransferase family 2 protein [Hyunsoonleella aquatilis]MBC3757756.1 glycosyltransferase family 2 protein [Hyunsoonleella aquatilis]